MAFRKLQRATMRRREDEGDPGADDPSIDPCQLIEDLKVSRHVLHIAEYASKTFDENLRSSTAQHVKEFSILNARRELAENAIHNAQASTNHFLLAMFVRFGHTQKEALAFRKSSLHNVKTILRRRILLKRRGIDLEKHAHVQCRKVQAKKNFQYQQSLLNLQDKKASGDLMFRTRIPNAHLKRVARQTCELIQRINGTMMYMELVRVLAGKFNRIREYMHDDAVIFSRNSHDLMNRILQQKKEIEYINNVTHEATNAAHRAEAIFNRSSAFTQAENTKNRMLQDLREALKEHQDLCTRCTTTLVELNDRIKGSSDNCMKQCLEPAKIFPYAMPLLAGQPESQTNISEGFQDSTELSRTFEILMDLTKARHPDEAVRVFHEQVQQANRMQADAKRLEDLLESVLRPECAMFEGEEESSESAMRKRAAAADKCIKRLQDQFDEKVEETRHVVNGQRDNAEEFENFVEILQAINDRIVDTFAASNEQVHRLRGRQSILTYLEETEKNLDLAVGKMADHFEMSWHKLSSSVENAHFLEYRATKIPTNNNRLTFDTNAKEIWDPPPRPNPSFITNAQFKAANQEISKRTRLAQFARLKQDNKGAEKQELSDTPTESDKKKL